MNSAIQLHTHAIGQRLPAWAEEACADYALRFPPTLRLEKQSVEAFCSYATRYLFLL